jgi:hypothetical protein
VDPETFNAHPSWNTVMAGMAADEASKSMRSLPPSQGAEAVHIVLFAYRIRKLSAVSLVKESSSWRFDWHGWLLAGPSSHSWPAAGSTTMMSPAREPT